MKFTCPGVLSKLPSYQGCLECIPSPWSMNHTTQVSSANLTEGGLSPTVHVTDILTALFPVVTSKARHSSLGSILAPSHPLNPCLSILEKRMLCREMSNALHNSREMASVTLPLSTSAVTLSLKFATEFVKHDLPLVKPCWLSPICHLCFPCALPSFQGVLLLGLARHRAETD